MSISPITTPITSLSSCSVRLTGTESWSPHISPLATVTRMESPSLFSSITALKSSIMVIRLSSTIVIISPASKPASSAGIPSITSTMYSPSTTGVNPPTVMRSPIKHNRAIAVLAPGPAAMTLTESFAAACFNCSSSTSTNAPIGIARKNRRPLDLTLNPRLLAITPCAPS